MTDMVLPIGQAPRSSQGSSLQVVRNGLSVIGPDRPRLAGAIALALLVGALETLLLYVVAAIAISMSGAKALVRLGPASFDWHVSLAQACVAGLVLAAFLLVLSWPLAALMASLSSRAITRLRARMLDAYLGATLEYRETQREGLLQQLIGEYALRAENTVQQLTLACVGLAMFVMVLMGAIASAPLIALGMIGSLALTAVMFAPLAKRLRQDANTPVLTNREIVGRVAQAARMGQEIAAYDVREPVCEELSGNVARAAHAMGKLRFEARLTPNLFQYGAIALVLVFVAGLASFKPAELAGLAPLALLLIRALTYVRQLQRSFHTAREMAPYIASIDTELAGLEAHRWPEGSRLSDGQQAIVFSDVCYAYKDGPPALSDLQFTINPGDCIGVVGPSGGGKSTLTGLLLRLRMPTSGTILVGGISLDQISAQCWSRLVGYVPQDNRLLYGSVDDNIRLFRPGFSIEAVREAASAAGLDDEIMALPQGYQTMIGPGARGLSGGQAQRLAIARALIGKPRILIMDEPTSALDQRSESVISAMLADLKHRVTIVLVAHRPATLALCDRIFEVRKGALTELMPPASPAAALSL